MSKGFDFDTPAVPQQQRVDFKELYFNPEKGINTIRIVSLSGTSFKSHYVAIKAGGKKFVKCPGVGCPICIDGSSKPSTRYLLKIIDRKNNKLKVWEFGSQIKTQIQEFVNDIRAKIASKETDENDKLSDYNVELRRREPGTNPLYSISVKERLSTDPRHQAVVAQDEKTVAADNINLEELAKPRSVDRIKTQVYGELVDTDSVTGSPVTPAPSAPKVSYPAAGQATVAAKTDIKTLTAKASNLGPEDDSWLDS